MDHLRSQITRRGAYFENFRRSFTIDPMQNLSVAAVGVDLLVNVSISAKIKFGIVVEPRTVEPVFHCSSYTVVCVSQTVNIANLIPVVSWDWALDDPKSRLFELNKDLGVKVPFV